VTTQIHDVIWQFGERLGKIAALKFRRQRPAVLKQGCEVAMIDRPR
jgi:hypothetical protein